MLIMDTYIQWERMKMLKYIGSMIDTGKLTSMGMCFFSIPLVALLWWLLRDNIMLPGATSDATSGTW